MTCVAGGQCYLDRAAKNGLLTGRRLMGEVNEEKAPGMLRCGRVFRSEDVRDCMSVHVSTDMRRQSRL